MSSAVAASQRPNGRSDEQRINPDKITPMLRQYLDVKERYGDAFVLFRVGDFYELFLDDAVRAAPILNIALTSRDKTEKDSIPLCGVPHHTVESYINKLIQEGYKAVICDQVEDPRQAKGLVRREVVRVITPGTVTNPETLDPRTNNYIAAICPSGNGYDVAVADISCGELNVISTADPRSDVFERLRLREVVISGSHEAVLRGLIEPAGIPLSVVSAPGTDAVCDLLSMYVNDFVLLKDVHFGEPKRLSVDTFFSLDDNSRRDLEIFDPILKGVKRSSLLDVMDTTVTSMGSRKLRYFLTFPLKDAREISSRLAFVEALLASPHVIGPLRSLMKGMGDLERILGNITGSSPCPRYLVTLKKSIEMVPDLRLLLSHMRGFTVPVKLNEPADLAAAIKMAITDDPPFSVRDGGVIRPGYSAELDEFRGIVQGGTDYLYDLQKRERERTGIASLKVAYNRVFGYYIEISKANLHLVPAEYVRKQTLVNAERFITDELKRYEDRVLGAAERVKELETHLFREFVAGIKVHADSVRGLADEIARLDVFAAFAQNAIDGNYVKPILTDRGTIDIRDGRHPFVEKNIGNFVPNDAQLDSEGSNILLITGPNMAGKSTYMRQVALLVIMAQVGSYVPATRMELSVVDGIYTRIGTSDFLSSGKSTFMVEMLETAKILRDSTGSSLVVLDEVGRGTSTYDGLAIAWAVLEYLARRRSAPFVLFSTHYHELTELANTWHNIRNCTVSVREWKSEIIFLHKVRDGAANRSYGIHVAKLAGLPGEVLARAEEILAELESGDISGSREPVPADAGGQMSLFSTGEHAVLRDLAGIRMDALTPLDAFDILRDLKSRLGHS